MNVFQKVRRPLVGIACAVGLGLCAGYLFYGGAFLLLGVTAGVLAIACWRPQHSGSSVLVYLCCGLLAAAYFSIEKTATPASSILSVAEVAVPQQEVVGRITEPPTLSDRDGSLSFRLNVEAVFLDGAWVRADQVVRVYINDPQTVSTYGERWRVAGRYRSYEEPRAGVAGSMRTEAADTSRLAPAEPSLRAVCYAARERALTILSTGVETHSPQSQLLSALLLGYRRAITPALYQTFAYTGTLHIFAISGLHVGVLATILIFGLKIIGVPRNVWGIFLIPALLFYVFSTGMKPSAFRAFTMASVYFAAPLFGRRPDPVSAIALAAIILLAINPFQISDPGFLLSFTVVSGIVMVHGFMIRTSFGYFYSGWARSLKKLSGPHPLFSLLRAIGLLMLTSVAAWIFSAPLTARFFNTLSPVALIGNLAIIPLTFIILFTGCLSLVAFPVFPFLAIIFNHANRVFVGLLMSIIDFLGRLPGAYFFVRPPSLSVLIAWYCGLLILFVGPSRFRRGAALLLVAAALFWARDFYRPFYGVEVHTEGSMATAIRISPSRWVLVTQGSGFATSKAIYRLQREGVRHLYALVVSGYHTDIESIEQLCKVFCPEQVWISPDQPASIRQRLQSLKIPTMISQCPQWEADSGVLKIPLSY